MTLIDLTPVSATSHQIAAVCTEFECVVGDLVAQHEPTDRESFAFKMHVARGFDTDRALATINGDAQQREVSTSALIGYVQNEYGLPFPRARDIVHVLVDIERAHGKTFATLTLSR